MRRFAIIVFSFLLLCLMLGFFLVPSYSVTVTQAQINQAIADNLPFETEQRFGSAVINAGSVTLSAGNRVATAWELEAKSPTFSGKAAISAALQIHYEDGAFYLKDLRYDEIQIALMRDGADAEETTRRDLGDLLVQGARSAVLALRDEDNATLPSLDPELNIALKELLGGLLASFLNTFPVYDLRSAGGNIALVALVLEEVRVEDGQVSATFAAQRLISQLTAVVLFVVLLLLFVGRGAPLGRGT